LPPPGGRKEIMRAVVAIPCLVASLVLAVPVVAQQAGTNSTTTLINPFKTGFTGADPREIKFTPIDVNKASKAFNLNNAFRTPAPAKTISLTNLFPKFSMPSWPPKIGVNQVPAKNPFQPNRPVGVNLFDPKK
jgi:hypothetical protein